MITRYSNSAEGEGDALEIFDPMCDSLLLRQVVHTLEKPELL